MAELQVTTLGAQGDGIADLQGRPVFLPFTLPGDRVEARVAGDRGEVIRFIDQAQRIEPACPHFGRCGGCSLQHMPEEQYRDWKRGRIVDALAKKGFSGTDVAAPIQSPPHSRRRAVFAFQEADGPILGYHGRRSPRIVDIAACPILLPDLEALIPHLKELLRQFSHPRGKIMLTMTDSGIDLLIAGVEALSLDDREVLAGFAEAQDLARIAVCTADEPEAASAEAVVMRRPPVLRLGGADIPLPPAAFLQATREAQSALIEQVLAWTSGERVADLFCGCGTFAVPLSEHFTVFAADGDGALIAALDQALRGVPGRRARTETRNLFLQPLQPAELAEFDTVVFDPPRAGAKAQAQCLADSNVPVIIAISCNPSTFARDARILADSGYLLEKVMPVDQFLWSAHVELAALFTRET